MTRRQTDPIFGFPLAEPGEPYTYVWLEMNRGWTHFRGRVALPFRTLIRGLDPFQSE